MLTAGGDQVFPRGLPVGVVEKIVRDPERDSFIDVIVKPAAHLDRLDEVLVITSIEPRFAPEQEQDLATSEALKGAEVAAIKEQKKASEIMAERLPGLIDPNAPPDQQPLQDSSPPNPVLHPPQALHPDRFTPGMATGTTPDASTDVKPETKAKTLPEAKAKPHQVKPALKPALKPASKVEPKPGRPASPGRNP